MRFENLLAPRTRVMGASAIREILKVVAQPGMISLAGGIPAPESFPLELMGTLTETVLTRFGSTALQYDRTEGFAPLQAALADRLAARGIQADADAVLITSGSQGTLDAIGKLLIAPGDSVAVEAPTYLGALQAFSPYEPAYETLETDDDGLIPESLEDVLTHKRVKFVYLVPTFQNPTGRSLPLSRRRRIAALIQRHDTLLVEDDPYSELRYRGEPLPSLKSMAPEHVVYTSTLSKVLAPGLRIGYVLAPEPIARWLVIVKQGVDLHTSTLCQALAAEYITGGHLDRHLPKILAFYRPRQEAMLAALAEFFPREFHWSKPEGGMFIWAEGPDELDTDELAHACIRRCVAYVPGRYFYSRPGQGLGTMRLNYTMTDPRTIRNGVRIVAEVLREAGAGAAVAPGRDPG
ncbi:MAG: PLP-dependent aminotransferase family protein [Spirochaetia bacterium]